MWYADWLSKMGSHAEATHVAERARELAPFSVDCCSFLGLILYRSRRYREAMGACQAASELDPYYPVGHWFLGHVYQQIGDLPATIAELNKAVDFPPFLFIGRFAVIFME
jgi:tetratricopeptide (TPR) repeat protein